MEDGRGRFGKLRAGEVSSKEGRAENEEVEYRGRGAGRSGLRCSGVAEKVRGKAGTEESGGYVRAGMVVWYQGVGK